MKYFCQVCVVGIKSGVLGRSPASWKEGLNFWQSNALLHWRETLLPGFVPCFGQLPGRMAQLSLERVEEIPGQNSSELGDGVWRGECEKDSHWDWTDGLCGTVLVEQGNPTWQLCKAPAEGKVILFPLFASKIITYLRSLGLFGADLILVLEIYLWIWVLQSGRAAGGQANQNTLASLWKH